MRILKRGMIGVDVRDWQFFLLGQKLFEGPAITTFGPKTEEATKAFQKQNGFVGTDIDGAVGPKTLGVAISLGYQMVEPDGNKIKQPSIENDQTLTAAWPPKPNGLTPILTNAQRQQLFGIYKYTAKPIPGNPENIIVDPSWEKANIVTVLLPGLNKKVQWNKAGVKQLVALFQDWTDNGLIDLILTFDGTYVPRFIRGSKVTLSAHSFGSAFDINVQWNQLNTVPALKGKKGSTRELVAIANKHGFYWGGHFSRKDGMHFEIAKLLPNG